MGWQFLLLVRSRPEEGTQTRAEADKAPHCPNSQPRLRLPRRAPGCSSWKCEALQAPALGPTDHWSPGDPSPPSQEPWLWPVPGSLGYSPVTLAGLKF